MKYRLDTPYKEKDAAKALGARWDPVGKYWYYETEGKLPDGLMRWYFGALTDGHIRNHTDITRPHVTDSEPADADESATVTDTGLTSGLAGGVFSDNEFAGYKTVSEVNSMIQNYLLAGPSMQNVLVKGEITNFSGHRKGQHYYFSIKDTAEELLNCFMFENTGDALTAGGLELKNGEQVAITGSIDYYGKNSRISLKVRRMVGIGEGAMKLALMKLKQKLEAEGLFDEEHKKPIPRYPKNVGIVTSRSGMAIKDICKVAAKRDPYVQLILYHVNVQGKNAVSTIVKGIEHLDRMGLDSIIVGRGGGTDEELMCYNSELIARAVYAAKTPIVSAVGHEGHWTLIDLVADKRVATPSEAAEETVPDVMKDVRRVREQTRQLSVNMRHCIERRRADLRARVATLEKNSPENVLTNRKNRLKNSSDRLAREMQQLFVSKMQRYDRIAEDLKGGMQELLASKVRRFELAAVRLHGLSPTSKLVRGFGYISRDGKPVSGVDDVKKGDDVQITVHDGTMMTRVTDVEKTVQTDKGEEDG
ncbi:MAG: exodeoxyribonuclease VII large subunit [Lachnospiraceae bacterium]|nr:exodeoxyribonuclease VII large subunit [Lachnospiraceae bacterium]